MKTFYFFFTILILNSFIWLGCASTHKQVSIGIDIIFDTDANNELDDQQALAYLMLNDDFFNIVGITTNATRHGGYIDEHTKEAERILTLCNRIGKIPLIKGANASFEEIYTTVGETQFDGYEAVNFIIEKARNYSPENKIILLAVGKLTNVALALKKEPSIAPNIRLLWLGSNYPEPGEYNLEDDIPSMNYVLQSNIHFELVPANYNRTTGTDAVRLTKEMALKTLPGKGPQATHSITGRHGGEFYNFGDYSADLFRHIDYPNEEQSRALFDMAAVAIIKEPSWATPRIIACPVMINEQWVDQPQNERKIILWEHFDKEKILEDFFKTLKKE